MTGKRLLEDITVAEVHVVGFLVGHHHQRQGADVTREIALHIVLIDGADVKGGGTGSCEVPMQVGTILVHIALQGNGREAAAGVAHVEFAQAIDGIALVFQDAHCGIPAVNRFLGGNLRAAVGLGLVLGQCPAIQVRGDGDQVLEFVHIETHVVNLVL